MQSAVLSETFATTFLAYLACTTAIEVESDNGIKLARNFTNVCSWIIASV